MNTQEHKNLGRVLLKALWAGGMELLATPAVKAGMAVVEVIRQEWVIPGNQPALNAEAIAELTPQEALSAIREAQQENPNILTPEKSAELEATLLNLPRTFFQAGSRVLASVADFTRAVPLRPLQFNSNDVTPDGQYRLKQFLGAGSFGEVWRATHLDKRVDHAVKFCTDPFAAQILLRERDVLRGLLAELNTPHVVRLEQSNFASTPPYLAFAFCPGGDLVDWIARRLTESGRIPFDRALVIFEQMTLGLAAAHQLGIVHRDMKPGNILLDDQGRAVITDFGLGRIGIENNLALFSQLTPGLSAMGLGMAGTPLYMPPEIRQGKVGKDDLVSLKQGDVYALGVTAFQLFVGDVEAEPVNVRRLLQRRGLPTNVIDLLEDCLSEPAERPSDALAVYQLLNPQQQLPPITPPIQIIPSEAIAALAQRVKFQTEVDRPNPTPSDIVAKLAALARKVQDKTGSL